MQNHKKDKMIIILCTLPHNTSIIPQLIKNLLDHNLAACISTINGIHSFYYWENNLKKQTEIQLLIKTKYSLKTLVFRTIKKLHPYNTPELLILSILDGDEKYLTWMQSTLQ